MLGLVKKNYISKLDRGKAYRVLRVEKACAPQSKKIKRVIMR